MAQHGKRYREALEKIEEERLYPPADAMRLVKENAPRVMMDRVMAHIRKQGYFIVDKDPDAATLAAHPRIAKVTTRAGVLFLCEQLMYLWRHRRAPFS